MEGFFDSDKFRMRPLVRSTGPIKDKPEIGSDGYEHLTPVHWRFLGEKKDHLYETSGVRWSDVVINDVPLEKSFEYEDDIIRIEAERSISSEEQGVIMVNSRPTQPLSIVEEVDDKDKRWVKRLERLYPMNFQEAKKKKKSIERYPVKPKGKKQVRDEKLYCSSDKFQEITDEKGGAESVLDYTIMVNRHNDYEIIKDLMMRTPSDPFWPHQYHIIKKPIYTKYCPPLHWLEPYVQWEKIFVHLNEILTGKKRKYVYYPDGPSESGREEPCIYFYDGDRDSDDTLASDWCSTKNYMDPTLYFTMYYPDFY